MSWERHRQSMTECASFFYTIQQWLIEFEDIDEEALAYSGAY